MAFKKGEPRPKGAGRRANAPNKVNREVKEMVLAALDLAGGTDYLLTQAHDNPKAFLALLSRIIPTQVTGKDGKDLFPEHAADPERAAAAFVLLLKTRPKDVGVEC